MSTPIQDDPRRPDQIEDDIARTRAEVSSTIDAIQSKLTPGEIMDQALQYLRTNGTGEFGRNLGRSVRENPLPVALIGVGIAWLMVGGGRRASSGTTSSRWTDASRSRSTYATGTGTYDDDTLAAEVGLSDFDDLNESPTTGRMAGSGGPGIGERVRDTVSSTTDRVRESVSSTTDRVKGSVSGAGTRARDLARQASERLTGMSQGARQRAGSLQSGTRDQYYRARERTMHLVDEQPLVIGALGIALGAAIGAAIPTTRRENELLGSVRDELVEGAMSTAREQMETVKASAQRVAETAREEVHKAVEPSSTGAPAGGATGSAQGNGTHGTRAPL
ncbi:MAG TPA: DUF3618 domain-containing protein [Burkholderiaceae bacterium]|nr:DUF3618 domain-containing protein [Burkholderiaceae bacterium]